MKTPGHLWQPKHHLETFHINVRFTPDNEVILAASGRTPAQRKDLWKYRETFTWPDDQLTVTDAIHHLALAVVQDRPSSDHLLHLALRGGSAFEDVPLPF